MYPYQIMRILDPLRQLNAKPFFSVADVAALLKIKPASARVFCSRYTKEGAFVRLKNNFYLTEQRWDAAARGDFFRIANFLQVPSYVSFLTALAYYEVTTQVPRMFFESACLRRTKSIETRGAQFSYYKLQEPLYFDFIKKNDVFIATPEKALSDALYLVSLGKYKLDFTALSLRKIDRARIKKVLRPFPDRTQQLAKRVCKI